MPSIPVLYYRLAILNEVASGKLLSQRFLAERLEVSLGQTNKLLRGLESEGLIRVNEESEPRYALTAAGRKAGVRAAREFASVSCALLRRFGGQAGRRRGIASGGRKRNRRNG